MANDYKGSNDQSTMQGNTKEVTAKKLVNAIPKGKFKKIRKMIKDC